MLGYPRGLVRAAVRRARRDDIEAARRHACSSTARSPRIERATVTASGARRARRARSAPGIDPRTSTPVDEPERYDAVAGDGAERHLRRAGRAELRRGRTGTLLRRRSSTTPRCACCSSSTAASRRFYWTNIADPALPFVGLVEHTNLVEPGSATAAGRFLYVANYVEPGSELLDLDADALLDALRRRGCGRSTRPSTGWVRQRWRFASRPAQPIVTVGYHERIPPLDTGVPGLRARQHDADLSRGPGHQLRRALGAAGRCGDARVDI